MNTCATCDHWGGWEDDDTGVRYVCSRLHYNCDRVFIQNDALIYTRHDFGCVEWEPRQ